MNVNLEKLNRIAQLNEERLRNAKNTDVATVQLCNQMRATLAKIAKDAGFVRGFDGSFRHKFKAQ